MADGMFGAPTGISAGQADNLALLSAGMKLQEQEVALPHQQALTRLANAQAGTAEFNLQGEQAAAAALAKASAGGGGKAAGSNPLWGVSDALLNAGLFTKGMQAANYASMQDSRAATARAAESRQTHYQYVAAKDKLDLIGRLYSEVTDQASLDAANAAYVRQFQEMPSWAEAPYSPDLVKGIQSESLNTKQRMDLAFKQRDEQRREADSSSLRSYRAFMKDYHSRMADEATRRGDISEKNAGSKGALMPAKQEILDAAKLVQKDFPSLPAEDAQLAGRIIASRARMILRNNRGLDAGQALQRAYEQERGAGSLQHVPSAWYNPLKSATDTYTPRGRGKSPSSALPAPADRKFQPGSWYTTPKGPMLFQDGMFYSEQEAADLEDDGEDE